MNLASLASIFRHWLTAAAGVLGLWLIAALAFTGEEGKQLTDALGALVEPTVAILGLIVVAASRLAISWLGKLFGRGAGEIGGRVSGIPVWVGIIGAAAAIGGSLPSCSLSEYPISGSISFRDESGAKAGITFYPPARKVTPQK